MKFAKELEEDLVPEWRVKYFNYKLGKKKIKAVSRALRNINHTPQTPGRPELRTTSSDDHLTFTHYDFNKRGERGSAKNTPQTQNGPPSQTHKGPNGSTISHDRPDPVDRRESVTMFARSPPLFSTEHPPEHESPRPEAMPEGDREDDSDLSSDSDRSKNEETPLNTGARDRPRYGSIVGTPPEERSIPTLQLPDPALDPSKKKPPTSRNASATDDDPPSPKSSRPEPKSNGMTSSWEAHHDKKGSSLPHLSKKMFSKRSGKVEDPFNPKKKIKRAFTTLTLDSPAMSATQFEAYHELDAKQEDFFNFLDNELNKIEKFYKQKEDEASARLQVLREQLHEMRDRRLQDLKTVEDGGKIADDGLLDGQIPVLSNPFQLNGRQDSWNKSFLEPITNMLNQNGKIGKTSKAREELSTPRGSIINGHQPTKNSRDRGDYVKKQPAHEKVPYRFAKRKLKLALQEFYRGLELLKSYALLNRTAFRKINKKYDKAVMARPPLRYMSEKVNNTHFVQSTLVEETLVAIEDLYARYFERGNRKVAVNKLRSHLRTGDRSPESFRNGLYVAAGSGFALSGLVNCTKYLFSDDLRVKLEASYILQMYAGYFLAVLLFLFFVLDCRAWTRSRINYTFVFEYDTRHTLDWRQLAELPCFFLFLNGFFLWLNFQFHDQHVMHLYWPVVLIGITVLVIFLPFKILYYRARKWFLYSNWRLLLAGLYPVEFRDFYLGDMYCSETYAMSQMEIFFCLYATRWGDPQHCNSNHSRLLGFLTTLPAVWRALQCLRRYYDSRNWFPHLANFAKYCCNILYYMSLSLYRVNITGRMKALFIAFALINGLYCAFWDVFMDFSLGNPWSKNFLLRDNLAFRKKRYYYMVMVVDIVLRQQWIAYAIFTEDLQHSAIMSFIVGLLEVMRRGMWSLFRVENEHCNNVQQFRASRDIPLPYSVPESRTSSIDFGKRAQADGLSPRSTRTDHQQPKDLRRTGTNVTSTGTDLERADTSNTSLRSRRQFGQSAPALRALQRVGSVIAAAHSQDFQKKRRPEVLGGSTENDRMMGRSWTDDEDDDDDDAIDSRHGSAAAHIDRERRLDSREDLSHSLTQRHTRTETIQEDDEDEQGAGPSRSGSGSGSGASPRGLRGTREERDVATLQRADTMDDADISEARDKVERARSPGG